MSFLQVQRGRDRAGRVTAYVHVATSVWDQHKGRSGQQRVYLGKLSANGQEVLLSKGLGVRGGNRVAVAELRQRLQAGENLEAWLRTPPTAALGAAALATATVAVVGDAHVLLHLAEQTGLRQALTAAYGERDGLALLGLALHQTVEGRPLYLAGDWLAERELPAGCQQGVAAGQVYALVARLGADVDAREGFFRAWFRRHRGPRAVVWDTTSLSTYSASLELAEFGYNRDDEDLPQINLCLVANRDTGLPLWCRPLPGSIPDVSTLCASATCLRDLGLSDFCAALDRGFYSQANVRELAAHGIDFVMGVPFAVARARQLVRRYRGALASPKRSFSFHGRVLRHVQDDWEVSLADGGSRTMVLHVYFDVARQAERIARLEQAVFALQERAAKETFRSRAEAFAWRTENAGPLAKCLAVRGHAGAADGVRVERKPRAVARATAHMGYTVVLASRREAPASEVLADYRGRDRVEKLFDSLKNEDGQHRLRTGVDAAAEGRLMVAFAALVLRAALEAAMRAGDLLRQTTTAEFLAQMRKVKAITTRSGTRILLELTRQQRRLLASVKLPLPS